MRVFDSDNNELDSYDVNLGRLEPDRLFIKHHEAIEAVEEICHYEVIAEYPNGGKDVEMVVDVPAVEAKPAWDEYEAVKRYVPYTDEELAAIAERKKQEEANAKAAEEELKKAREEYEKQSKEEEARRELLDKIDAQVTYTALQTNTLHPYR